MTAPSPPRCARCQLPIERKGYARPAVVNGQLRWVEYHFDPECPAFLPPAEQEAGK